MSTCVMFRSCGVFASKNALWATTMMVVSVMSTCVMFRLCGLFDDDDDDDDDGGKRNEHVCDVQIVWGIL